jgi:hypothetical protein
MRTKAESAAYRRSLAAIEQLTEELTDLCRKIENDTADGDDTQGVTSLARNLVQQVSILGALRESREAS